MDSGAPLDKKWKIRLHYNIFAPFPLPIPLNNSNFIVKGTLQLFCRLPPTDFFENWKWPRSPTSCPKILKKITQVVIDVLLQITQFGCRSSNGTRDIRRGIFGEFPPIFSEFRYSISPKNLEECMGGRLRRNLEVWTIFIEPFFRKIDVHILPSGFTV